MPQKAVAKRYLAVIKPGASAVFISIIFTPCGQTIVHIPQPEQ